MVFQISIQLGLSVLERSEQHSTRLKMCEQKTRVSARGVSVIRASKYDRRLGKAGQHQAIPGREYFFIAARFDSLLANREKPCTTRRDAFSRAFDGKIVLTSHLVE